MIAHRASSVARFRARSMEVFRRLGVANKLREVGLPADYPKRHRFSHERGRNSTFTRFDFQREAREALPQLVRTPLGQRRNIRIGSIRSFSSQALFAHVREQPRVRILNRTQVSECPNNEHGLTAIAHDLDRGDRISIECTYLVGCDGATSMVRKAMVPSTRVLRCFNMPSRHTFARPHY